MNFYIEVVMNNGSKFFRFVVEKAKAHTGLLTFNGKTSHGFIRVFGHKDSVPCSATIMFLEPYVRLKPEWNEEKLEFTIYLTLAHSPMFFALVSSQSALVFNVNFENLYESGLYLSRDIPISRDTYQILSDELFETQ